MARAQYYDNVKLSIIGISSRINKDGRCTNSISFAWLLGDEKKGDWVANRFITLRFSKMDELFSFLNELKEKNNLSSIQNVLDKVFFCASIEYEIDDETYIIKKVDFDSGVSWNNGYFGLSI